MQIFISYSRKDRPAVETLAADLTTLGNDVTFDQDLRGGQEWWPQILDYIRKCDLFIFALSQTALDSLPCQHEYGYAHALNKRILPVLIGDVDDLHMLPPDLQSIHFEDYRKATREAGLRLSRTLRDLPLALPLPDPLPPPPPTPLPLLAYIAEQVKAHILTDKAQKLLMSNIRDLLKHPDKVQSCLNLLEILEKRLDLSPNIKRDVEVLLSEAKPVTGHIIMAYPYEHTFKGHEGWITSVAFAPDGNSIASGGYDKSIRIWNVYSGELIQKIETDNAINSISYMPNNRQIITGTRGNIAQLWNIESSKEECRFEGHIGAITSVVVSRNGQNLLTASEDGTVRLWNVSTGKELRHFRVTQLRANQAIFSPSEKSIASVGNDDHVKLWELSSGKELRAFTKGFTVNCVDFSLDGQYLLIGSEDRTARILDANSLKEIHKLAHSASVWAVKFSPDNSLIITGDQAGLAHLWEAKSGRHISVLTFHKGTIFSANFSPDGRAALTGGEDGMVRLWLLPKIV